MHLASIARIPDRKVRKLISLRLRSISGGGRGEERRGISRDKARA